MNNIARIRTQQKFDEFLQKITDSAAGIKNDISDDDLMLICCLMAEIAKIASNVQPSK